MNARSGWLSSGLFLVALATLMLEVLDTRLLSVLTWYHLSFLAVSLAMLGMAAGAVLVFAGGEALAAVRAARVLPGLAGAFAISLAASHVTTLVTPFPTFERVGPMELAAIAVATVVLAIPFVLSGMTITVALTRTGGPIGGLYAADLVGAAGGCLLVVWLLERTDLSSAALAASALAGLGAFCFARWAGRRGWGGLALGGLLLAAAFANARAEQRLGIVYPKSRAIWFTPDVIEHSTWNAHSNVVFRRPVREPAFLWGPAADAARPPVTIAWAAIDGDAGTAITAWDGDTRSLDWVSYDVTALPYQLRRGRAAVIGAGGGRDLLTALWAGSTPVVGIEVNGALVEALQGRYRDFAGLAGRPDVKLVHDEARSWLTRSPDRFEVIQMSLIDTWAATGAGAFTLSENGLYTREAWRVFLNALNPGGVLSVSRWFEPNAASETTRLLSLGIAALLDRGVARPREHLLLASRERVATLLVSPSAFSEADRERFEALASRHGFSSIASPWAEAGEPQLRRIAAARSLAELEAASRNPLLDFTPPTDARPFFFNMLKPRGILAWSGRPVAGVITGNIMASVTVAALLLVATLLVGLIIGLPLLRAGRPALPAGIFGWGLAYFALIGFGFMLIQIALLQRFSIYLGHPTYSFSIILFLMILAAGLGSLASDRLDLRRAGVLRAIPAGIAAAVLLETLLLQPVMDATIMLGVPGRSLVVACFVVPLALLLGLCFPVGIRLVGAHSEQVTAWMWGVNGACGVLGSILAVLISIWLGIPTSLLCAALLYATLALPLSRLAAARPAPAS